MDIIVKKGWVLVGKDKDGNPVKTKYQSNKRPYMNVPKEHYEKLQAGVDYIEYKQETKKDTVVLSPATATVSKGTK